MHRFVRENSLSLFFASLFLGSLAGHSVAGWLQFNDQQVAEHLDRITWLTYVTSADFAVDVAENWQSEFLQFLLYLSATVWLLQKGSPESKELDKAGRESDKDQKIGSHANEDSPEWAMRGDWRTRLYSSSLALVMAPSSWPPGWSRASRGGRPTTRPGSHSSVTPSAGGATWATPTSGPAPCRTGRASSSPSAPWRSSPSICANAAPLRANRWVRRMPPLASKAERPARTARPRGPGMRWQDSWR